MFRFAREWAELSKKLFLEAVLSVKSVADNCILDTRFPPYCDLNATISRQRYKPPVREVRMFMVPDRIMDSNYNQSGSKGMSEGGGSDPGTWNWESFR